MKAVWPVIASNGPLPSNDIVGLQSISESEEERKNKGILNGWVINVLYQ